MTYTSKYLEETVEILNALNTATIDHMAGEIGRIKHNGGRLFIVGVGGSAATASHAVNDFRKIAHMDAQTPVDNVAELTARTNDNGWENVFKDYLRVSRITGNDGLLVLSVGGGTNGTSPCIVEAVNYAKSYDATVMGIIGRDGGHTGRRANPRLIIPDIYPWRVTPHVEGISSVILHLLVTHPGVVG